MGASLGSDAMTMRYMTQSEVYVDRMRALERVEQLEAALRAVVSDIEEYQRINNLFPSPGKPDCWQSVTRAKSVLRNSGSN